MPRMNRRTALSLVGTSLGLLAAGAPSDLDAQGGQLQFEVYKDKRAGTWWRLKAANGRVIATSGEGYKAKADCLQGIKRIRDGAAAASLKDLTLG